MLFEIHFFCNCWPQSRFSKFWTEIETFSKMSTEIEIFEILSQIEFLFENVDRSRDFWNFEPKSFFFSNMLTEIEIFEILNRNRNIFKKCWPKWRFPKFWTEIGISLENIDRNQDFEIFNPNWIFFRNLVWNRDFQNFELKFICFQNVDRNQNFRNFEPKSKFFRKCWPKMRFFKYWTEIKFFSKILNEIKNFEILNRNRIFFFENVVRNRDHRNFEPKSKSLWKCWQKRDFRNFQPKLKFFRKCWPVLRFTKFWLEIDFYFRKYWSKPRFSKFWTVFEIFPKLLTEIEIFKISNRNGNFLENVDRNRLFFFANAGISKFTTEIKFFIRKYWPKSRFSKFWTKMEIFSKMLIEIKIFQILNPNRAFFENVDGNLNRNRFFFANVDRNRDFWNFEPKSNFFFKMLT